MHQKWSNPPKETVGRINLGFCSPEMVKSPINLRFHASETVKPSIEYKSGLSHEMVICRSVAPPSWPKRHMPKRLQNGSNQRQNQ